jgi:hypothetical protein
MLRLAVWQTFTDVSDVLTAFIIRAVFRAEDVSHV